MRLVQKEYMQTRHDLSRVQFWLRHTQLDNTLVVADMSFVNLQ